MVTWKQIRYPRPIKRGDKFAITAPSSGVTERYRPRLRAALNDLTTRGFTFVEGHCLLDDIKTVSGSAQARAGEFMKFWVDPSVAAIFPPWGGELLLNILEHIDFKKIEQVEPKWLLGYSDISTLQFAITTRTGVATAHGINLMDSILANKDPLSAQSFSVLATNHGESVEQKSSEHYQTEFADFTKNVQATFRLEHQTQWKALREEENLSFSGRIIGGCLDTIRSLIGTPFGDLPGFASKLGDEKVILYLENSGLAPTEVCRALWNMRLAGWFKPLSGIVMGRSGVPEPADKRAFNYRDALEDAFAGYSFPIIVDADIGHQPPQLTIINGARAHLSYANGKGSLKQSLI